MKLRLTLYLWWRVGKSNFTIKYIWNSFWGWIKPYFTPKMIPIVLSLWVVVNGMWYVLAFAPIDFIPNWLRVFAQSYIAFLWSPIALEKPFVIIPLSGLIYKIIYKGKFNPIYKVKLVKKYNYERYGLSRRNVITLSSAFQ